MDEKEYRIQLLNFKHERAWKIAETAKWVIGGLVIIFGFLLIKPREQNRLDMQLQVQAFEDYVATQDTQDIDLWQRKLDLMLALVGDGNSPIQSFLHKEQERINTIRKELRIIEVAEQKAQSLANERKVRGTELEKQQNRLESAATDSNDKERLEAEIAQQKEAIEKLNNELEESNTKLALSMETLEKMGYAKFLQRNSWWNYYQQGVKMLLQGETTAAKVYLKNCLQLRPKDQKNANTYGMHFIDYFPLRELGVTYYIEAQKNTLEVEHKHRLLEEAISLLTKSIEQEESERAKLYLRLCREGLWGDTGEDIVPP